MIKISSIVREVRSDEIIFRLDLSEIIEIYIQACCVELRTKHILPITHVMNADIS